MFKIFLTICSMYSTDICEDIVLSGSGDIRLPYTCMIAQEQAVAEYMTTFNKRDYVIKFVDCAPETSPVKEYYSGR